jgi:hypothetical protein
VSDTGPVGNGASVGTGDGVASATLGAVETLGAVDGDDVAPVPQAATRIATTATAVGHLGVGTGVPPRGSRGLLMRLLLASQHVHRKRFR